MSSTNRAGLRAGVLGLMLGCVPAVWLVCQVVAAPGRTPPNPAPAVSPTDAPAPLPPAPSAGGLQLGQSGQQLGQPVVSSAQEDLRLHFPFESLAKRLDYEKAGRQPAAEEESVPRLTEETRKQLAGLEEGMESKRLNVVTMKLIRLHSDPIPQLPRTPAVVFGMYGGPFGQSTGGGQFGQPTGGFGQFGTFSLTREELTLPPAPAIPFASVRAPGDGDAPLPKHDQLATLHADGLFDFLDPAGFGYVKDREHVAGFEPHQFRHMPDLSPERGTGRMEKWAVIRLELVSLLKHGRPSVYVTSALPRMADPQSAPTRPLIPFEEKGLKALKAGDDLATESSGDRIRMVGSLRAGKQCLECHEVKRGELLGAFSWELQRQTADDNRLP